MGPHHKVIRSLLFATVSVAIVLALLLFSAALINYAIAPLLVDASKQLLQVQWQEILYLCYFGTYVLLAIGALMFLVKFFKQR